MNWVTIKYSRKCTGTVKLLTWLPRCLEHTGHRNESERPSDMTWSLIKVTIHIRSISSLWMLNLNSWIFESFKLKPVSLNLTMILWSNSHKKNLNFSCSIFYIEQFQFELSISSSQRSVRTILLSYAYPSATTSGYQVIQLFLMIYFSWVALRESEAVLFSSRVALCWILDVLSCNQS